MKRLAVLVVAFLVLLLAPEYARADAIVITSGDVYTYWDGDLAGWQIFGDGTRLGGENFGGSPEFDSGTVVNLSRTIAVYQDRCCPRSELVEGTTYPPSFLRGSFSFSTPVFTAPTAPQNTFRTFEEPFTMVGHLEGFAAANFSGAPMFAIDLTGAGTASVGPMRAITIGTGTAWINKIGGLIFSFADPSVPSPTPEPATLALLASGFALAVSRAFKRRSH